jgi:hypothetical protein
MLPWIEDRYYSNLSTRESNDGGKPGYWSSVLKSIVRRPFRGAGFDALARDRIFQVWPGSSAEGRANQQKEKRFGATAPGLYISPSNYRYQRQSNGGFGGAAIGVATPGNALPVVT